MSPFLSLILFTLLAVNGSVTAYSRPEIVQRGIERRMQGDVQLFKRFSNAKWTFFDVGLGACGQWNVENDFIVALNAEQFGSGYPGPNCFRTITMSYNGKTAQARIMDRCPGCPYGGLDLSRGLFRFFDIEDKGVIYGEWHFGQGAPAPAEPAPTTTSAPVVVPTTTSAPPPPPPPPPAPTATSTYVPPAPQIITTSVPAPAPRPTPPSVTTTTSSYVPPPAAPTVPSIIPDAVSPSVVPVVAPTPTSIIPSLNLVSASITSSSASVLPTKATTTSISVSVSTPPSTTGVTSSSAPSSPADPSALPTTTTTPVSIADMSAGDLSGIKTIGDLVVHLFNLLFAALQQSRDVQV